MDNFELYYKREMMRKPNIFWERVNFIVYFNYKC